MKDYHYRLIKKLPLLVLQSICKEIRFLKSAVSKQIENEEVAEMDVEGMISDLDGEQIDQVLSGLSERNTL